jgi:hypothetical protein
VGDKLALAPGGARDQLALHIFKSLRLSSSLLSSLALDFCIPIERASLRQRLDGAGLNGA